MMRQLLCFLSVMCGLAWGAIGGPAVAQQAPQPSPPASPGTTASVAAGPCANRGVQGFPYSADEISETTRTLADGTKITSQYLSKVYRDSQGRTRQESFGLQKPSGEHDVTPLGARIFDPVACVMYQLNPHSHTARITESGHRTPQPPPPTTAASANPPPATPRPTTEDLGTQVMEGVKVIGTRTTTIIPAGAEGNDRPIQFTREFWSSPELRVAVMSITNDPRYGETVIRLTHLLRDEPPADLFQVPPDYTIEELKTVAKPVIGSE